MKDILLAFYECFDNLALAEENEMAFFEKLGWVLNGVVTDEGREIYNDYFGDE